MINVSEIVTDPDFAQTVTVKRNTGGDYNDDGTWVNGSDSEFTVTGSLQKVTERDIKENQLGEVRDEMRKLLTPTEIKEAQGDNISDRFTWNGKTYKVIKVGDNSDYGYYRAFGVLEKAS